MIQEIMVAEMVFMIVIAAQGALKEEVGDQVKEALRVAHHEMTVVQEMIGENVECPGI